MTGRWKRIAIILLLTGFAVTAYAYRCAVCGKDGFNYTGVFIFTDHVTGEQEYVCLDCMKLPRCYICGLPVKEGEGVKLPDGRVLCARDAKTAVLDVDEATHICLQVKDDLDKMFLRFTQFPTNVDISVIDRVDVDSKFDTAGHAFESPDVLGWYHPAVINGTTLHQVRLLTGQPATRLKDVCAHELSHAWVHANVPAERLTRLNRDAEEGFCEMVGYLLVDSENDEVEKKRILANHYTRGQVQLFLEAEQRYGFQQVLDWMQYGETGRLVEGHLDEIRDVKMDSSVPAQPRPASNENNYVAAKTIVSSGPETLVLQSILRGAHSIAIINGHSFFAGDEAAVKIGTNSVTIRCLSIGTNSVRIQNPDGSRNELLFNR